MDHANNIADRYNRERANVDCGQSLPCSDPREVVQLEQQCRELREKLDQVKVEIVRIISDKEATGRENSALKDAIAKVTDSPPTKVSCKI